jgi:DNA-binding transcriptional LysR family regulator
MQRRRVVQYRSGMSLDQIRYFVAVAEEENLTRAARRLHVSQPPVSRQLRALEEEIGGPLFARHAQGMSLLPAGRVFLEHARRILSEVELAVDRCRREIDGQDRSREDRDEPRCS